MFNLEEDASHVVVCRYIYVRYKETTSLHAHHQLNHQQWFAHGCKYIGIVMGISA